MKPHVFATLSCLVLASCVAEASAHVAATTESSSFARYYVRRLPTGPDVLTISGRGPWAYAMVRGADDHGQPLANISFDGSNDLLRLEVPPSAAGSAYEIIVSSSPLDPSDPALVPARQAPVTGVSLTLAHTGYFKMDRDPPPPPENWHFPWSFQPAVSF